MSENKIKMYFQSSFLNDDLLFESDYDDNIPSDNDSDSDDDSILEYDSDNYENLEKKNKKK